jgi:hypothetical protein
MRSWEPSHTVQLRLLAAETVSGWRHRYGPSAVPGLTRDRALRLLVLLSRYSGARTGAAVALDEAFADGG